MLQTEGVTDESMVLLDMASTHTGVFTVDEQRRVVFWNEGATRVLGYTAEQSTGLCCCDILGTGKDTPADCSQCLGPSTWKQVLDGEVVRHVMSAVTRDGTRIAMRTTSMLAHNADGAPRVVHFVRERRTTQATSGVKQAPGAAKNASLQQDASDDIGSHRTTTPTLTKREREVLKLLATGLSNQEIAGTLRISPITARNHVTSVIEKFGVRTRLQAVVVATRKGWL